MPINEQQKNSLYFLAYLLLGILVLNSSYLSYKYINFFYGGNMLASLDCADDCDSVMMSPYSMLWGVPVPVYGLAYFLALAAFFILLTAYKQEHWLAKLAAIFISHDRYRLQQKLFELMLILGCLGATAFLFILYGVLHMFCKFCLLSHIGLFLFTINYFFLLKRFSFKLGS
jgi:uncharacterized membrane protein